MELIRNLPICIKVGTNGDISMITGLENKRIGPLQFYGQSGCQIDCIKVKVLVLY